MSALRDRWRAVRRVLYRTHQFVVFRCDLAGPPAADAVGDIVFRLATPDDLDRLDALERYGRGSRQRRYVEEDKDWLFVACRGDRIVATRRYSRAVPSASRDGHGLTSRVVQLRPDQVWGADVFCLPEYRSQGIGRRLALFGERFLASLGYTELFGTLAVANTASIRMSLHKGSQPIYSVSYRRLLFYERLRVTRDVPGRLVIEPG